MRFVLAALIWLILVGGLSLYIHERDRRAPAEIRTPTTEAAPMEDFTLEITPTFATEADPFSLHGDTAAATMVVRLGERELFRSEQSLPAGVTVSVHPVAGLATGLNELFLKAGPPLSEAQMDHAVNVRLLQGSRVVFDETVWGRSGANVAGTVSFTITGTPEAEHDH